MLPSPIIPGGTLLRTPAAVGSVGDLCVVESVEDALVTLEYVDPASVCDPANTAADLLDAHEVASNPHPGYQQTSQKGQANGYASLDSGGHVPSGQIPDITFPVTSVSGRTGAVVLAAADITDSTTAGRALLTAADSTAQRTSLELTSGATAALVSAGEITAGTETAVRLFAPASVRSMISQHNGLHIGHRSGIWYHAYPGIAASTLNISSSSLLSKVVYVPILLGDFDWNTLGIYVETSVSGTARLGIYSNAAGIPGELIAETPSIDTSATGEKTGTIDYEGLCGWHFLAFIADSAVVVTAESASSSGGISRVPLGITAVNGVDPVAWVETSSGITLPATAGTLVARSGATTVPRICIKG